MKTYIEQAEVVLMEQAATTLRDRLLIRLLYRLGCRISEILGIEVDYVDFTSRLIIIQHLKTRLRVNCPFCQNRLSRNSTYCPGCGSKVEQAVKKAIASRKMRNLPVDSETLVMLEKYIELRWPGHQGW